MNIQIDTAAIQPMLTWLKNKKEGRTDEAQLREILKLPEYIVELERYADETLPVCTLTLEEVVDFFLHFDEKTFDNPRLQTNQPCFLTFYENMEKMLKQTELFMSLGSEDMALIRRLLNGSLPDDMVSQEKDFNIILLISIGNSQGYPWKNNIVFDVAKLDLFPDRQTVSMVFAHEIHHTFFADLLPNELSSQALFAANFAFEGLAVHFCNNGAVKGKEKKYADLPSCGICDEDFMRYDAEFDALFMDFHKDFERAAGMTEEEVMQMIAEKYEKFEYVSRADGSVHHISQYPTYYLGCYLFGSIDNAFGKGVLLNTLQHPERIADTYNQAAAILGNDQYLL